MIIGRGNPFGSYCPDESAWVRMRRTILSAPQQGILIRWLINGERSGALYRLGYASVNCDGLEQIVEDDFDSCIACNATLYASCNDYPGEGSRYAQCEVSTPCTTSCQQSSVVAGAYAFDNCEYQPWESHYCEAWAYVNTGGASTAGANAYSATYYQGSPYTTGYQTSLCNGFYDEDYETRPCPQF